MPEMMMISKPLFLLVNGEAGIIKGQNSLVTRIESIFLILGAASDLFQNNILKLPGTRFIKAVLSVCLCILLLPFHKAKAQSPGSRVWQASVERMDGKQVFFQMIQTQKNNREIWYIKNAGEKIPVTEWREKGDSVFFSLPAFEVSFRARREGKEKLNGQFLKQTTGNRQYWPFMANAKDSQRYVSNLGKAGENISGRWDVTITRSNGTTR